MNAKTATSVAALLVSVFTRSAFAQIPAVPSDWVGSWATAPYAEPIQAQPTGNVTYREIVHLSQGSKQLRVVLSNEFGTTALKVVSTHIALSAGQSRIDASTDRELTFDGRTEATIPPGARLVSDAVTLAARPLSDVSVSFYLPSQQISVFSVHPLGLQDNYAIQGDHVTATALPDARVITAYPVLRTVEVVPPSVSAAIVCLGDSITDGRQSTPNANARWPNVLAARLMDALGPKAPSVLDLGIGGNRLLATVVGPAALARFDRDVLSQANLKYLILLEGINDIRDSAMKSSDDVPPPTAQDLTTAYQQIISRAHAHHVAVLGATLLPYGNATYYTAGGEAIREQVNAWIRVPGHFDAVLDFDKVVQDPAHPLQLAPVYNSGDSLHPNDDGYMAMANSIPVDYFTPAR